MLKTILTISGKPGLYKLLSRGRGMVIVETVDDQKKRFPVQGTDKVVSLGDISIFTEDDEMALPQVLELMKQQAGGEPVQLDVKKATNDQLRDYFAQVLPQYDRDRVYPTHIKKIVSWYNLLLNAGITQFVEPEAEEAAQPADEAKEA